MTFEKTETNLPNGTRIVPITSKGIEILNRHRLQGHSSVSVTERVYQHKERPEIEDWEKKMLNIEDVVQTFLDSTETIGRIKLKTACKVILEITKSDNENAEKVQLIEEYCENVLKNSSGAGAITL